MKVAECTENYSTLVVFCLNDSMVCEMLNQYQGTFYVGPRFKLNSPDEFEAVVMISSAEICSRIIGRQGSSIRYVRVITSTTINSPKIERNHSSHCFRITASKLVDAQRAVLIILLLADYFKSKMEERLYVSTGEIRMDFPVIPQLVPQLTGNRGQFLVALREQLQVNIVSPKPYSEYPRFAVIGLPHQVQLAMFCLIKKINLSLAISTAYF